MQWPHLCVGSSAGGGEDSQGHGQVRRPVLALRDGDHEVLCPDARLRSARLTPPARDNALMIVPAVTGIPISPCIWGRVSRTTSS